MIAVTFDYGQTLAELDTEFLARRVAERGARVSAADLETASPVAWAAYDDAKRRGDVGFHGWAAFMRTLLERAPVRADGRTTEELARELVDFLWSEQPRQNLWRRPIAGMEDLLRELRARGGPLGIVSNSEGRLAELLVDMGWSGYFDVVADSGKLGVEKPDRKIFDFAAAALERKAEDLVHVGDAWVADVEGARGAGARAIWITRTTLHEPLPEGVLAAGSAAEVRAALVRFGVFPA